MKANEVEGRKHHPIERFGVVGQVKGVAMSAEDAAKMLPLMICGAGSCVGLYTANTRVDMARGGSTNTVLHMKWPILTVQVLFLRFLIA